MANKISIFRGQYCPITYQHVTTAGVPINLTGCKVYFTVKQDQYDNVQTDSDALIQKTISSFPDPTTGLCAFALTDADTYIEPGTYYFDFVVENASGQSYPPSAYGSFIVKGHPTNRQTVNG